MAPVPAPMLSLAVAPRRPVCVLDPALAFARCGLLLAQRLSTEAELWVPRELWQILDNLEVYARRPGLLDGDGAGHDAWRRDALRQWEVARAEQDLAGLRLHFIGDGIADSMLPAGEEVRLVHRFASLVRALDAHVEGHAPVDDPLAACAREAAALAVALSGRGARILTTQPARGAPTQPPALCALLAQWGLASHDVAAHRGARIERELLLSALTRAGAAELAWAGLELAAVHVVAPRAAAIPSFGATMVPVGLDDDALPYDDEDATDWWSDAGAYWYPLTLD